MPSELDKELHQLKLSDDAKRLRKEVRQEVGKPERYKCQGKKIKRALHWPHNRKRPTQKAPKGFIKYHLQDKEEAKTLSFGKQFLNKLLRSIK